jgi:AcrR family transcriptional regulator
MLGEEAVDIPTWEPRRLAAVAAVLPEGVTPPGTRGRILREALALYAEIGFHGTSIRAIAARVGINSATLYAHYPSKTQVLAELVLIGHRELHARLTAAVAAHTSAPGQLAALVHAHVLLHADYPLLAVVTESELHALPAELATPALERRAACRRLLLDVLERGAKDGDFPTSDLLLAATAISGMGMRVAHWFGPDQPYTREQVADQYARYALSIVSADHP